MQLHSIVGPLTALGVLALALRIIQVRRVRFNRVNSLLAQYAYLLNDLDRMTYKEAGEILKVSQHYDLPLITALSLSFALFKTYAVPTISAVLCKSTQLASIENVGRRAEDTAVVIGEFINGGGLDSERGATALARMNFLHSRYGDLITRDDKLYTLSAFVFEPAIFSKRFEWRELTPLEEQARYVLWREVGARMGITDIPPTKDALWKWKSDYEDKHFVYADTNKQVGDTTLELFARQMPVFMQGWAKRAASVFMDEQTRSAFKIPTPELYLRILMPSLVRLKGLVCGYLLMPRDKPPLVNEVTITKDEKGKTLLARKGFLFEPWYVEEGTSGFGLFAYIRPGKKWHSEGFRSETIGPDRLMDSGVEKVLKQSEEMREQAARGCPFFH